MTYKHVHTSSNTFCVPHIAFLIERMTAEATKRIALAVPLEWEYAHRLTEGVLDYHNQHAGYVLRDFRFSDPHFERPADPPSWEGWQPHGVLCAVGTEPGLGEWLLSSALPLVNMTADVRQDVIPSVHASSAGKVAVDHFVSLGYKHIAHVGLRGMRGSELRRDNIRQDIEAARGKFLCHELENDPVGSTGGRLREAANEPGLLEFLSNAPKPLAVSAMNDDFARCVCMACGTLGLEIPTEVAVAGVDDSSAARLNVPPISTVCPPGERVGYEAMKLLESLIEGGTPPAEATLIPCEKITVRQSTQLSEDVSTDRAVRLIEAEACKGLSVGDLTRFLGVSRSTFEKRFTEQVGRSPAAEIQRVKLDHAKRLLADTELSITRITGMVGFSRSSVFGAFFKKGAGSTPTEYRKQHRGVVRSEA